VPSSVQPALRQQRGVRAALDNPAAVDHQDQVGRQDGAQAVGDDDAGAPGHHPLERILDQRFGFAVQVAGGLVQHQDARVFEDHARQGDALLLAAAQAVAALAHDRVVAVRQPGDEVVDVGRAAAASIFGLGASSRAYSRLVRMVSWNR
jgi:hypothetical protein